MFRPLLLSAFMLFLLGTRSTPAQTTTKPLRSQRVTVSLQNGGYKPSQFRLKRGVPARVTFVRKTDDSCGDVVVIPAYGIRRDLPLNQPVTVSFTPKKTGTFSFACGMDMFRGRIVVN